MNSIQRPADLGSFASQLADYTELRVQENRNTHIALVNGDVVSNVRAARSGVSARSCVGGLWGFCSAPTADGESIERTLQLARKNAQLLAAREKREGWTLPTTRVEGAHDYGTKQERRSQKELIEFLRQLDAQVQKSCPGLSSRTLVITCLDMEKTLLTSTGSSAHSLTPRALIYIEMTVMSEGAPISLMKSYGGLGHFEDRFADPKELHAELADQYEHTIKKSEGIYAEAGTKTCILAADLAGILAHEAIGHTTEADFVRGGSVARHYLNETVASPLVTLVDFAHTALGKTCPVPVHVDDEGTESRDVTIIEDGVLRRYMHNKETAAEFGHEPLGNARAYQFSDEPLIRMRNTAILPGQSKLDEMIASIDDGYFLMKPGNGQADSTSEFMFAVTQGYEIKNGKLGRAIKDTTISGIAFDLLKTVEMVSGDMVWSAGGMCGKKQLIPVGMGGPAIKCSVTMGGK
ncbi:MAG: peptidase [Planctomycetota bacterium]|nr:MAG: peptidase [Planctomycetota bacterium]